jgi:hypothetical protein
MLDKSGVVRATAASVEYVRHFGSSLFAHAERFYEARMEKAQMRLAPTRPHRRLKRLSEFHRR